MAKYNIKSLNYIAVGQTRSFINMDIELGYELYDYIHLLCAETETSGYASLTDKYKEKISKLCVDIGTEHGEGYYYPQNYIERDPNLPLSKELEPESVILNEQQNHFVETDADKRKYIRLYLSCCTEEMKRKIQEFNNNREQLNCTYLLENAGNDKNNLTAQNEVPIKAMYDIRDVSIRKLGRSEVINPFINDRNLNHHDIYAPAMREHPIGFCQANTQLEFQTNTLIAVRNSVVAPNIMKTDLLDSRGQEGDKTYYNFTITPDQIKTYTYKQPSAYQLSDSVLDKFTPERSYLNTARSFILDIPVYDDFAQNSIASNNGYDEGEIYYQQMMVGKNMYDSRYSMSMSSVACILSSRTYCGVGTCAGYPYLKYYDDTNYNTAHQESGTDPLKMRTVSANSFDNSPYSNVKPYQKIEYMHANSETGGNGNSAAKHKSNVFSVTIKNTGIGSLENVVNSIQNLERSSPDDQIRAAELRRRLDVLKFDITNAIKEISRNITPADTQLFDIYFKDTDN